MTTKDITTTLSETIANVLEAQAFMFAETSEAADIEKPVGDCLSTSISFAGPVSGGLGLIFPSELCIELTANILGLENDEIESLEDAGDALKEFINVVCGQFLTSLYSSDVVFRLSIPQVEETDLGIWQACREDPDAVCMMVDSSPILAYLSLRESPS